MWRVDYVLAGLRSPWPDAGCLPGPFRSAWPARPFFPGPACAPAWGLEEVVGKQVHRRRQRGLQGRVRGRLRAPGAQGRPALAGQRKVRARLHAGPQEAPTSGDTACTPPARGDRALLTPGGLRAERPAAPEQASRPSTVAAAILGGDARRQCRQPNRSGGGLPRTLVLEGFPGLRQVGGAPPPWGLRARLR